MIVFLEFCFCKKGLLLQIYEKNRKIGVVSEIGEISVIGEIGVIKKFIAHIAPITLIPLIAPIHKKNRNPTRDCGQYSESYQNLFDGRDSSTKEIV